MKNSLKNILLGFIIFTTTAFSQNDKSCQQKSSYFICTWKTNNAGTSNNTSITIPVIGGMFNYDIDWNDDGIFDEFGVTASTTHDFGTEGIYKIAIKGDFPRIYFNNRGDKLKLIAINQWGSQKWKTMNNAFWGCINLEGKANDKPDLSSVIDMDGMFENASSFNQDIGDWDTSNITTMAGLFTGASSFNQNINDWDTSNVTDMSYLFSEASSFSQKLNHWNTSNVNNMQAMFQKATKFNGLINTWNTHNVTDMQLMFSQAIHFNQDISNWNTSKVETMHLMFQRASVFNQNIEKWNTKNVINMAGMFANASNFDQNIGSWNVSKLSNATDMFISAKLSTDNYDALLNGWKRQHTNKPIKFNAGLSNYCEASVARDQLINNCNFTIVDNGHKCNKTF